MTVPVLGAQFKYTIMFNATDTISVLCDYPAEFGADSGITFYNVDNNNNKYMFAYCPPGYRGCQMTQYKA